MNIYRITPNPNYAHLNLPSEIIRKGFTTIAVEPSYKTAKEICEIFAKASDPVVTITKVKRVDTRSEVKDRNLKRKAARKGKQFLRNLTLTGYELVTE